MKIVIDLPENEYRYIKEIYEKNDIVEGIYSYIYHGTPLPKEHGRLIDADALEYTCNSDECGMLTGCNHCQYHIITEDEIDNAPTIIEADKCTYKETGCGSCKKQLDCPIEVKGSD